ncbi:MAG: outer membrane protein assembly factor BamD, partial [Elusimicrobia bacterium]|nr:outer membrane protein assembly factor BamD [Elusimicrobiota bacterium]
DATQQSLAAAEQRHQAEAAEAARKAAEDAARLKAEAAARDQAEAAAKPSEVFQTARRQYDKGDYDLAAQGFQLYLDQFPKGETADLAGYYLGQARYAEKKYEEAARAFALVLDRYASSDVTPATRLRYAESLLHLGGHDAEAKRYLESIPQDYAKSPEAVKAHELLRRMGRKKTSKR